MTDIARVIGLFVEAARRADRIGIELMPNCMPRTDILRSSSCRPCPTGGPTEYGGSLENRMRFLLELTRGGASGMA
jgi:hypothetical protein